MKKRKYLHTKVLPTNIYVLLVSYIEKRMRKKDRGFWVKVTRVYCILNHKIKKEVSVLFTYLMANFLKHVS